MKELELKFEALVEVRCGVCGGFLDFTHTAKSHAISRIEIIPCPSCMFRKYNNGRDGRKIEEDGVVNESPISIFRR